MGQTMLTASRNASADVTLDEIMTEISIDDHQGIT